MMTFDTIWLDARLATVSPDRPRPRGDRARRNCGEGWPASRSPVQPLTFQPTGTPGSIFALDGRWITPGLIDCHNAPVYAGDRAHEFELRLAGASYEEIARAGGGIVSTVKATRAASEDELIAQSLPRLDALVAEGITTIEISRLRARCRDEARMLRAARPARPRTRRQCGDDVSRRARDAAGIKRQGPLHRSCLRHDPGAGARPARGCG